jgi:hypothetical protein
MSKPPHVESFEKFADDDEIRNYIAFGLFMEAENDWVANKPQPPTSAEYKNYHENVLSPRGLQNYKNAAEEVIRNFANKTVNSEQTKLLADSLLQYRIDSAAHHQAFRLNGVKEAVYGAFLWTVLLIAFSFILVFANIDPIEYYHKAYQYFHRG